MTQINEYNTKVATPAEFEQWSNMYNGKSEPPENIKQYAYNSVLAAEQQVDNLYNNIKK
jgi:hypothetical protein